MESKVFLAADGIIHIQCVGAFDREKTQQINDQTISLALQLHDRGLQVRMLCDITKVTGQDTDSREVIIDSIRHHTIEGSKTAVVANNPVLQAVGNLIMATTGKGSQARVFSTEEQAMAWLKT